MPPAEHVGPVVCAGIYEYRRHALACFLCQHTVDELQAGRLEWRAGSDKVQLMPHHAIGGNQAAGRSGCVADHHDPQLTCSPPEDEDARSE